MTVKRQASRERRNSSRAVRSLSKREMDKLVDRQAHRFLGMSAKEFYEAADKGTLPKSAAAMHVLMISGARTR